MTTSCRCLVAVVPCLPWALTTACVPVESDLGGTRPPPTIDGGNSGVGSGQNDVPDTGRTMVFDVVVEASSLAVDGITVDATLTVATDNGGPSIMSAVLRDTANNFKDTLATIGIAGGVLLTASTTPRNDGSEFTLSLADDGSALAVFTSATGTPGVFVLQGEGVAFNPGEIGDTYQVQTNSSFGFRIDGNVVTGTIDLNGVPISGTSTADVYTGTFSGSLR